MTSTRATASPPLAGTPDAGATLAALRILRPDLVAPFRAALPGARAAVLARLWGALAREPLPGLTARHQRTGTLEVTLALANRLAGPREVERCAGPSSSGAADTIAPGPAVEPGHEHLTDLDAGTSVCGPVWVADAFAVPPDGLALTCDGRAFDDPAELARALGWPERFVAELANSVANLALGRAAQPPTAPPWRDPSDAEQSVVDGHPLHPGCRTRHGMTTADVLAYAPEHRPLVALPLVAVPAGHWLSTGERLPPLLPMHPWQFDHVRDRYPWLRPTGEVVHARPLMSLRTLSDGARQLKTAVDVQMTSAVRTVSPAALHNGPAISALLARLGGVDVLAETAAGAALVDGEPCRSLAVVVRQGSPAGAVPLAALTTTGDPVAFVGRLAGALLPPLFALLRRGVALEAHGQNTLAVVADKRITGIAYRDMGGVRISPRLLRAHGVEPPPLHGDVPCDDPEVLRTKVYASAGVALAERVAALSRAHGVEPAVLWRRVAQEIRDVPGAEPADLAGLFASALPVKATTAMRLAADPLADRWATLPNPLAEYA
ncbi:IucA/IucC family protein [Rhizomonospora bruguierae]|uniref:IucA/IucC family protein n=1 Tax=Rhizomonospora bruguierae TaxID=1581705 RepID=UPI001BD0953F|nr:IucA/IucC family protein [Micromonospora sp. NBRC 107566]